MTSESEFLNAKSAPPSRLRESGAWGLLETAASPADQEVAADAAEVEAEEERGGDRESFDHPRTMRANTGHSSFASSSSAIQ